MLWGRAGCGGSGVAVAVAAAGRGWLRLCCVSCSSSTLWSMSLLCRSWFGVLPVFVQDRGYGPDSAARGVPQLQFLDKVVYARVAMTGAWALTGQETLEVPQLQCRCSAGAVYRRLWTSLCSCTDVVCLQILDQVGMPVTVQRQVRSLCGDVVDTPVVAQTQIPMVPFDHRDSPAAVH